MFSALLTRLPMLTRARRLVKPELKCVYNFGLRNLAPIEMAFTLLVNGTEQHADVEPEKPLLYVLRDDLGLTGTKYGCGEGQCGACTVLVDGSPERSCRLPVSSAMGKKITTIEGLSRGDRLHPVQQAFLDVEAFQCAYCTPGMIVSAAALLERTPNPSEEQIISHMEGNICRCGAYGRIVEAVRRAAQVPGDHTMRDLAERVTVVAGRTSRARTSRLGSFGSTIRFHVCRTALISIAADFSKCWAEACWFVIAARHAIAQESGATVHHDHELPKTLDSWLHISENGEVTAFTGKVEVGQNVRTSLAQQVAEELRVPLSSVRLIMGDTELTPYDMGTFGSRTTPQMGMQLRKVSASARAVLIQMAAERWSADAAGLTAEDGKVRDSKANRSITYAELVHGQKLSKVIADDPELTPAKDWKIAGTPAPKTNGRDFVTGAHAVHVRHQASGNAARKNRAPHRLPCKIDFVRYLPGGEDSRCERGPRR